MEIAAANGEPAIIQLGNLTLIFVSSCVVVAQFRRDRALKRYANFNPTETDMHFEYCIFHWMMEL